MRKGEFTIQGMLFAILVVGLFTGVIGTAIVMLGSEYDITGYDSTDLEQYNRMDNLSADLRQVQEDVDAVVVENNPFDWLGAIVGTILTPFKFIYNTFTTIIGFGGGVVGHLKLFPVFSDFIISAIIILVIVGIVMIKFYWGRQK